MNIRILPNINLLLMLIFTALAIFTPVYNYQTMVNLLAVFAAWFLTAVTIDKQWLSGNTKYFLIFAGIIILDYIIGVSNNDGQAMLDGINKMPIYCWVFFYLFYSKNLYRPKLVVCTIFTLLIISSYFTIKGNIEIPGASRLLAGSMEVFADKRELVRSMNIGGYDLIYALAFLTLPLMLWGKANKRRLMLCYSLFAIFLVTVVLGAYMIGILIMIALFAVSFLNMAEIKIGRLVIIMVIGFLLKDTFLDIIGSVGEQYDIAALSRHAEELETGSYGQGDKYNNRWYIYLGAIQNWLQSPLFGQLFNRPENLARSGHSELLGYMEKYGIFCLVYVAYFKAYYKNVISSYITAEAKKAFVILFSVFIVFGIIDRFDRFCGIGFMIFFFAPYLILLRDREKSNNITT